MNYHSQFKALLNEGFEKYGTNYGGSRLANNVPNIYGLSEKYIAQKLDTEDAVIVSSGTLAGHLLLTSLPKNQAFFHFKLLHPALVNQFIGKKSFEVNDPKILLHQIEKSHQNDICILLNSIHPVLVEKTPTDWIYELPKDKNFTIIIDDSHGIGIIGNNGKGIVSSFKKIPQNIKIILLASLGKAVGVPAGVIAGHSKFIDKIKSLALWGGGSPTPPAYLYAFVKGTELRRQQREKLQSNIDFFKENISNLADFTFIDQFPVFKYNGTGLYEKLLEYDISISKISYPTKDDISTERIVINSLHSTSDIEKIVCYS